MPHRRKLKTRRRSSGFVLAFVLICLTILILALMAMAQRLAVGQRQAIQRERQLQVQWLVEAGISRATAKLRSDSQYSGERWQLPAEEMGDRWNARVEIEVEPSEDINLHRIRVVAVYPDENKFGIRDENEVVVQIPSEANSP